MRSGETAHVLAHPTPLIRRRHVLYVEGYDPQGAEGYYGLFQGGCKRFRNVWPIRIDLGELTLASEELASWNVAAHGPNWDVATRYEFLRQEQFIRADMAEPMRRHVPRALAWIVGDLVSGALFRIFRASWRFGVALSYFELLLLLWLALPVAAGIGIAAFLARLLPGLIPLAVAAGMLASAALFLLLRPFADHLQVVQITNHWPRLRRYARGEATWFDQTIESGARRLIEIAQANAADEIVVIGHSGGGMMAPAVVARAFELDGEVGQRGPPLVLLTLGSIMPAVALDPAAARMRAVVARLARERSLTWIDCQSRKDILNFWDFDPVGGIGVDAGANRCNPLIWTVRFKDMVSPEYYRRFRRSFFRLHYQFIMTGDRRSPYDYLMLVAGPAPVAEWARRPNEILAAFSADGAFLPGAGAAPGPAQASQLAR
jgi:hypothetical protein